MPLGIMRKEEDSANQIYQDILKAIQKGDPQMLELSCEKTGRKLSVVAQEITAVQMTPKTGAASVGGARTGFVAQVLDGGA